MYVVDLDRRFKVVDIYVEHPEVNALLATIEGIGDNTSHERSVDCERTDLHDIHVNVVDDATTSSHCVRRDDDIGATRVGLADIDNEAEDALHGPDLVGNADQYEVIYDSDKLVSLPSSSNEDEVNTHISVYSTHGDNLEMHVKMKFSSHIQFKKYLVNYALSCD
ncbi:hypothetical protein FEM48_Zijuj09G0140000 [Ziziphus jujuba var. spinosa]|uniref:Uncharacterized protein n=1 Tax=Ziziphus jujuba var. spinosa TaxID=714518 RepID=A0A978UTD8_ZIZJJ|nr:hypothetical protein FEM48_Zijuj09G0140000 [Ziziphus jujuba var. spinosa]